MRIHIHAVGRVKSGPFAELYEEYARRFQWEITLHELSAPSSADKTQQTDILLQSLDRKPAERVVALDERGKNLDSMAFAEKLGNWRDGGIRDAAFVIGGADGFDDRLKNRADILVSFGKLTWPHQLVRVMLVEQIYRAQQILAGHPYHRE